MIDEPRARLLRRLAHDLRSPLAVLKGTLDDLPALDTPVERERAVHRAERAVGRLLRLADRLSLSGRTAEGLASVPQTVQVRACVEAAVDAVLAAEPRARLRRDITGEATWSADPVLLRAALEELVSNAIKHATSQMQIAITDEAVRVEDDGSGLDPSQVSHVFTELTPSRHGLGLGLPLAAECAHAMGMTLSVSARSGAEGLSAFTLRR